MWWVTFAHMNEIWVLPPFARWHLARRVKHLVPSNMEFVEDKSSTYAQLELIAPVRAGEQLFVDYGPSYAF